MKTKITLLLALFFSLTFAYAQQKKQNKPAPKPTLQLIQFHSEHRCKTCLQIEKIAKEAIKGNKNISFKLINVDVAKNEKIAEQFEATGTALFLYNPKTKKKIDLTEDAFMLAFEKEKLIKKINEELTKI